MAEVARRLGFDLMPWQRLVADVALEYDETPDGPQFRYRQVVVTVPRQSGKTTLILALEVWRAMSFAAVDGGRPQKVVYTAQTRQDAAEKLVQDQIPILEAAPAMKGLFSTRLSNGSENVKFRNGSLLSLLSTTEKSGHGKTLDMAVVDEAFAQHDFRVDQAVRPATITKPNAQTWVISTAGTGDSVYLWSKVERGRESIGSDSTRVAYFEWSVPDDADPSDPDVWRACMPALGHTIREDDIRAEFETMEPAEFGRAYLNRWTTAKLLPPIPLDAWGRCVDTTAEPTDDIVFALDVSPDRRFATVVVASRLPDGRTHLEVPTRQAGIDWVVPWLTERWQTWSPQAVWLDPAGPAGSFLLELESAGVKVETVSAREMGQACALLYDEVLAGRVSHRGDPIVTSALDAGVKRYLGDLWLWSRSSSSSDITPAVAVTLGVYGTRTPPEPSRPVFAF